MTCVVPEAFTSSTIVRNLVEKLAQVGRNI